MPRRGLFRTTLGAGILAAGLMAGCATACAERPGRIGPGPGPGDGETSPEAQAAESSAPLTVFAEKTFYQERTEPEETFHGVLRRQKVRLGPNTRGMPLRLSEEKGEQLSVYVSGFDLEALRPFVDRRVEILGKRIDLRSEGYGVEVWIATIALDAR